MQTRASFRNAPALARSFFDLKQRASESAAHQTPPSTAGVLQHTFGNRALARIALVNSSSTNRIQRGFEDGKDDDEKENGSAKGDGSKGDAQGEEEEREETVMERIGRESKTLRLTDRPWEEIERERDPMRKFFRNMIMQHHSRLQPNPFASVLGGTRPPPPPQPLLLQDAATVERNKQRYRQQIKPLRRAKAKAKAKAKREASPTLNLPAAPKPPDTKASDFHNTFMQRIERLRNLPSGRDFTSQLSELAYEKASSKGGKLRTDAGRLELTGFADTLEAQIKETERKKQLKLREDAVAADLRNTQRDMTAAQAAIKQPVDKARNASTQLWKRYFRASGEEATLDAQLPIAVDLLDKVGIRIAALRDIQNRLAASTQASEALAVEADTQRAGPDDAAIAGHAATTTLLKDSANTIGNYGNVTNKKRAMVDTFAAANQMLPHVKNYVSREILPVQNIAYRDAKQLMRNKLHEQKNIPNRIWLKNIFDYVESPRHRDPSNPVFIHKIPDIDGVHAHASIFKDTIVSAGTVSILPPNTADSIRDIFFRSSGSVMQAAHITMEVAEHGSPRNPHCYRGGPTQTDRLQAYYHGAKQVPYGTPAVPTDKWRVVEAEMRSRLAAEETRIRDAANAVINNHGTADWPKI